MNAPVPCAQCKRPVQVSREDWATPICFDCLPPPQPLPVRSTRAQDTAKKAPPPNTNN
jgi:hypothetical protein